MEKEKLTKSIVPIVVILLVLTVVPYGLGELVSIGEPNLPFKDRMKAGYWIGGIAAFFTLLTWWSIKDENNKYK